MSPHSDIEEEEAEHGGQGAETGLRRGDDPGSHM